MSVIALSLTMLEPQLLDEIGIKDSIVPGRADIVAQSFSERVGCVETGFKVRIEELSSPERQRRIEASLGSMASFGAGRILGTRQPE